MIAVIAQSRASYTARLFSRMFKSTLPQWSVLLLILVVFGFSVQFGWYARKAHYDNPLERLPRSIFMFQDNSTSVSAQTSRDSTKTVSFNIQPNATIIDHVVVQTVTPLPVTTVSHLEFSETQRLSDDENSHLLVVIVLSKHRERRDVIRETWKSTHYHQPHYNVTVKFSLGMLGLNSTEVEELEAEEMEHHDLILLPHLKDTYTNLTRKVLYSLEWVDQHLEYSYLFKCDDDSFALLDRMAHELANMSPDKGLFWGYFVGNAWPQIEGAWAEKNWFACDTYMPYAFGGGYVLSSNVVHGIIQIADILTLYSSEDVTMGAWTASFDIERKHDVRFDVMEFSRGCLNNFIVIHKQSIEDMYNKHKLLLTKNVLCEKDRIWSQYIYNWEKKPTRCCRPLPKKHRHK